MEITHKKEKERKKKQKLGGANLAAALSICISNSRTEIAAVSLSLPFVTYSTAGEDVNFY
jgi:hypothetical protein